MEKPFPAYHGTDPYIFVSYAHKDRSEIYPQLTALHDQGFNIWYDEGISPGSEWSNELASAIQKAGAFLFFGSPNSSASENCIDEISFALDHSIPLLCVHLQQINMPVGMQMRLNRHQAILKYELSTSIYTEKLVAGLTSLLRGAPATGSSSSAELLNESTGDRDLPRHLTTVLAADVCGYTRLMEVDEERTHRRVQASRKIFKQHIEAVGGRIFNTAGDSVMAEFGSVVVGVQTAVKIQRDIAVQEQDSTPENRVIFRMGVQIGDVIRDDTGDLFGECVNIAARLEQAGRPGEVTISETVRDHVSRKISLPIESIGEISLKNVATPMPLFSVVPENATAVIPKSETSNSSIKPGWLNPRIAIAFLLMIVVAGIAFFAYQNGWHQLITDDQITGTAAKEEIIIAVLPFKNLSAVEENAFFTAGVHEDVLAQLSKIPGLKVISRTSVMAYQEQGAKSVAEIASDLGVNRILEGSVRRSGEQVRINVQLIDATADTQIWSENYDRDISNIFATQSEVAKNVATQLEIALQPETIARLNNAPTDSLLAYDLYIRAQNRNTSASGTREAINLLERAIAEDPDFADAYASLAKYLRDSAAYGVEWQSIRDRALKASNKALALDPSSSAARESLAILLQQDGDRAGAIQAFKRAIELNPNSSYAYQWLANVQPNNKGKAAMLKKAIELDPLNVQATVWLANVTAETDAPIAEKEKLLERLRQLAPNSYFSNVSHAQYYRYRGDLKTAFDYSYSSVLTDPNNLEAYAFIFISNRGALGIESTQSMLRHMTTIAPHHDYVYSLRVIAEVERWTVNDWKTGLRSNNVQRIIEEWESHNPKSLILPFIKAQALADASRHSLAQENIALAATQRQQALAILAQLWEVSKLRGEPADQSLTYTQLLREDGQTDKAEEIENKILVMLEDRSAAPHQWYRAIIYARRDDRDNALDSLAKAYEHGWTNATEMEINPAFDWLREDLRYTQIMDKMKARNVDLRQHMKERVLEPVS